MENKTITEGKATILASIDDIVSKKLEVFYNPLMKFNRDSSIEVINTYFKDRPTYELKIALPLAGSGIRGVRFANELTVPIKDINFNDLSPNAIKFITENTNLPQPGYLSKKTYDLLSALFWLPGICLFNG